MDFFGEVLKENQIFMNYFLELQVFLGFIFFVSQP